MEFLLGSRSRMQESGDCTPRCWWKFNFTDCQMPVDWVLYIIYQLELLKWPKYLTAEPRAGDRFKLSYYCSNMSLIITIDKGLSVPYGMALQIQFFWQNNCRKFYDDCSIRVFQSATIIMYIEKIMMIISFTHKLVLVAAHWPGFCWQFQKGFPEPL